MSFHIKLNIIDSSYFINSIILFKSGKRIYEGMTNSSDTTDKENTYLKKESNDSKTTTKNSINKIKTNQGLPITPLDHDENKNTSDTFEEHNA